MTAEAVLRKRSTRVAFLAGMASYLDAAVIVAMGSAVVLYQDALGLTTGMIGVASGVLTLGFAVGTIVGGRLGDRYGRTRMFGYTLSVYAVGVAILAAAPSGSWLIIGALVAGLAVGADLPISLALIAEESPDDIRGRNITISSLLWIAGIVSSSVLVFLLAPLEGPAARIIFAQLALTAVVVLILRRSLDESSAWLAAEASAQQRKVAGVEEAVDVRQVRSLLRSPLLGVVSATGLYYAMWNLGANTWGQFQNLIWVDVLGGDIRFIILFGALLLPLSLLGTWLFMRHVDKPARRTWFLVGSALMVIGYATPALFGLSSTTMLIALLLTVPGGCLAGENLFKVWAQELVPTLLRGTSQGITMAVGRTIAGLFALVTPTLALHHTETLTWTLALAALLAALVGAVWVPRLPVARDEDDGAH